MERCLIVVVEGGDLLPKGIDISASGDLTQLNPKANTKLFHGSRVTYVRSQEGFQGLSPGFWGGLFVPNIVY